MTTMAPLLPALGALMVYLVFLAGYRMLRGDVVDGLDVTDLALLHEERRREVTNQLSFFERIGTPLVPLMRRLLGPAMLGRLSRQIHFAGRPEGMTVDSVLRRMAGLGLVLAPLCVIVTLQGQWYVIPVALLVVFAVPMGRLAGLARRRQEAIDSDLPDFLDILAVTVTAGIAFRPALRRVAARFEGPLSEDVNLALDRLQHGASVREAFEQMRDRSTSSMMERFVRAFLQAEELGAPLAETLNQIALDMRRDNAQRLRQKAARTVPRVTLVASTLLVPATLILLLGGVLVGVDVDFGSLRDAF